MEDERLGNLPRRMAALAKANEVRQVTKRLRESVRSGDLDAILLIRGDFPKWESVIARWRLEQLVPLVPGIGSVTAMEIYTVGQFSPAARVKSLSPKRREELARLCKEGQRLSGRAPGHRT